MSYELRFLLSVLETAVIVGYIFYLFGLMLTRKRFEWKEYALSMPIIGGMTACRQLFVHFELPFDFVFTVLGLASMAFFVFKKRRWAMVLLMAQLMLCLFVMELLMMLALQCSPPFVVEHFTDFANPLDCIISNVYALGSALIMLGAMALIRRLFARVKQRAPARRKPRYWPVYLRMSIILISSFGVVAVVFAIFRVSRYLQYQNEFTLILFFAIPLLGVGVAYFIRDLKYLAQLQRNETLEHQQEISEALIKNMRYFRHNLINMLYGFEGAIMSGEPGQVRAYYRDMTERCALVNNENIVALERVSSLPLSTLLLRAIERAQKDNIPFYLFAQENVRLEKRMKESDLVQIAGVLVDNAIEAAQEAEVKYVSVEIRNNPGGCELLVRNTYPDSFDPASLHVGRSTKSDHMGQGLKSCEEILDRCQTAFLNLRVDGQYVEAQVLL